MRALLSLVSALSGLLLPLLIAAPAQAASFDCSKATAADEVAVCRDGVTSSLDSEMGGLYFAYDKVPMFMGANGARHDDAEAFLAARGKCGADITCLRKVYTDRIAALKTSIEASMQQFFALQNGEPAAPGLPAGVEKVIAGYAESCKQLGGAPTLTQSEAGTIAKVWVDGSNCPKAATDDACWATYEWADGKHTVTYAASPAPAM